MDALPEVVFVLGGPGAGKGTQCARIVTEFGFVHLSAGDLLRAERQKGGTLGNMISDFIKEGKIIPVEITIALIKDAMDTNIKEGRLKFLIDGFPRNEGNINGWNDTMTGKAEVQFVLFLDCPEQVMEERLLGRNEGRSDDNLESIRKRFSTYKELTMPLIRSFEEQGKVRRIQADSSPDEVFKVVAALFEEFEDPAAPLITDDLDPTKLNFSAIIAKSVRSASKADVEVGKAKGKLLQFWELPPAKQQELLVEAVKKAVFHPKEEDGTTVKWQVSRASYLSISGGFHVYAFEKTGGQTVTHSCRVNSYGVLENYTTPNKPSKEPAPSSSDEGGCVVC